MISKYILAPHFGSHPQQVGGVYVHTKVIFFWRLSNNIQKICLSDF